MIKIELAHYYSLEVLVSSDIRTGLHKWPGAVAGQVTEGRSGLAPRRSGAGSGL